MRYWVYINDKVEGPFDEGQLVTLQGFTQDTLICSEENANSGNQEWVKASSIFEFDQQPAVAAAMAPLSDSTSQMPTQTGEDLKSVLLAKLDALTSQISGLQTKLDGMQTKLYDAISSQKQEPNASMSPSVTPLDASPADTVTPMDDSHANTITLTRHDIEAQVEEVLPPEEQTETPLDMLGPVDLGNNTSSDELAIKAGEDVVVSSALDSLYNARLQTNAENDINENTFQDLLTPAQAAQLAKTADDAFASQEERERTLDAALKQVEQKANSPEEKDKLIDSFSTAVQPDVVDQLIQEKEAAENKDNSGLGALAAGAAAGAAALASLGDEEQKEDISTTLHEAQTLSISQEEISPTINQEPPAQEFSVPTSFPQNDSGIPSLDSSEQPVVATDQEESNTQSAMEELVPGSKVEQNDGIVITEQDLKEAFTERKMDDQSVEQIFGVAETTNDTSNETKETDTEQTPQLEDLKSLSKNQEQVGSLLEPKTISNAPANPNELTEIQLKEGSTYLISDFVPPAQSNQAATPKELTGLEKMEATPNDPSATPNTKEESDVQEMVSLKTPEEKPSEKQEVETANVAISQVILENTVRTKRGASLDIKTVPMVPEPGESQRLHLEGMDDDLNTQHDLQEADIKPASKSTKVIAFSLVAILLLAASYAVLAFLHIVPDQFNILFPKKNVAEQQAAQMEEMLGGNDSTLPMSGLDTPENMGPEDMILDEVKNYPLSNGYTLKDLIESKHPAVKDLITWEIATAVDPDNYSILVKVPPENPQSFKISYRFNYNAITKELEPTISDAKNLLDSVPSQELAVTPVAVE